MESTAAQYWIWVFGDLAGLNWVLKTKRMAFSGPAAARASRVRSGDRAVFYVAQGAQPTGLARRATFQALATAVSASRSVEPFQVEDRVFVAECDISVDVLLDFGHGVDVKEMVSDLEYVRSESNWGAYFRMSPIPIGAQDFKVIADSILRLKKGEGQ